MEHEPLVSSQEAPNSAWLYWGCSLGESPLCGKLHEASTLRLQATAEVAAGVQGHEDL